MKLQFILLCLGTTVLKFTQTRAADTGQPENVTVVQGQNYTLNCTFHDPVNCSWHRNSIPVEIGKRYQFVSSDGVRNKQCSIEIRDVQEIDVGTWQCVANDQSTGKILKSEKHLLIVIPPSNVSILLNGHHITWLTINAISETDKLTCISENGKLDASLHWETNGEKIESQPSTTTCSKDGFCNSTLEWSGDWLPLVNSTAVSCIAQVGKHNFTATVTVTTHQTHGNASRMFTAKWSTNTTQIIFYTLLAAAAAVLLVVTVISLAAIRTCRCHSSHSDNELFKSNEEIVRCDSTLRIPRVTTQDLNVRNSLYNRSCAEHQNRTYVTDQCVTYYNQTVHGCMPSYPEQLCCKPYHMMEYANYPPSKNEHIPLPPRNRPITQHRTHDGKWEDISHGQEISQECYSDVQSTMNANGSTTNIQNRITGNAVPEWHFSHSPSCPAYIESNNQSEESLYNDCISPGNAHAEENSDYS